MVPRMAPRFDPLPLAGAPGAERTPGGSSAWTRWRRLRRAAARLTPEERRFALRAWLGAPAVELSLAVLGLRRTLAWIEAVPPRSAARATAGSMGRDRERARRPAAVTPSEGSRLVAGAYRAHLLRGQCLPRSLLQYLLHRRDGVAARLVVGVRRPRSMDPQGFPRAAAGSASQWRAAVEPIEAHAWVDDGASARGSEPAEFEAILVAGGAAP